jgi:hypothetical protein
VVGNPNPHPLKSFSIGRFCASEAGLAGSPSLFIYWRDFAKNKEKKGFKKKKLQNSKIKWFFRASLQSPEVRGQFFF